MISIIAIIGKNRELGKNNKLLWHIPGDLPRFRKLTSHHPIIMGKNTFLSIGKPLSDRTNIVVSREFLPPDGVVVARTIEEAFTTAQNSSGNEEIFVIGGGSIYSLAMPYVDRLYLTIVDASAEADTYFPDYSQFDTVIFEELHEAGEYRFMYRTLEKR